MPDSDFVDASSVNSENASSEHGDGNHIPSVDAPADGVPLAVTVPADLGTDIDAVADAAHAPAGWVADVAGGRGCGHGGHRCGNGACHHGGRHVGGFG